MKIKHSYYSARCFEWQKVPGALIVAVLLLSPVFVFGQQKNYTLKGNVKDNAASVPGASVMIQGTSNGTITDQDGNYQFTIASDKASVQIVFSSIGYVEQVQEVLLGAQETITLDVTLVEEVKQLDEVVVIGSTLRTNKRELGNNISSVSAKAL